MIKVSPSLRLIAILDLLKERAPPAQNVARVDHLIEVLCLYMHTAKQNLAAQIFEKRFSTERAYKSMVRWVAASLEEYLEEVSALMEKIQWCIRVATKRTDDLSLVIAAGDDRRRHVWLNGQQ